MRRNRMNWLACCALGAAALASPARADDCEGARAMYDEARSVAETDPAQALGLLKAVTAQCPTAPHGWFLAGNMHRELGDHAAARRAYRQAAAVADAPQAVEMARAYAALAGFELGELCEAQRAFRSLVPRPGEEVSDWLREPWEAFARAMADAELSADDIACALDETASDRTLGICPRVDLRIEFDYDSADIRADSRARVEALARALEERVEDARSFRLVGHSDTRGDAQYNQDLSERRAHNVRDAVLALQGAAVVSVDAIGKGEREPLITASSEADHRVNRRVEVRVICDGGA